ncbi:MAG: gliding motility-associated ABC transporter substrate-binding protein GldG [Sphingobacteriales bacterium 17-39-43]|uniref:gliding motility-associated ABC transporter substrate-binding protein GldG n=1 Tax=Daejeonella sp. TaxID=2805397 RepID=UPI000BC9E3B3|nr:gliding motility-associated ABC transporter substrate-binding protein GldG [Daejeonella sp.]OYZ33446.1 MAG: gliding motility-associated ABC transporter substrate-binding protein GldG [Sphingobacteriales bacterium 16-39-50]OZA24489.1 MAG: gliding motility-associated ABC transporter substrate-binding protein GldG [Sphingobacteriales bacterium 17-39-43]HQT22464.1 gliding motility-associated ABC transporter substrate-binding protein GldG [Daejeonella sp.]HQT56695.1 gliding motility-associated AB
MVNRRKRDLNILILVLAGIVILNVLSSFFFTRIDFTAEKRYTLSEITKTILADLDDEVQVTVYLEGEFPAGFKRLRNSTADLLRDFKSYSNVNLKFDFVNPLAGDQKSQEEAYQLLIEKGIEPTNLSVKTEDGMSQKIIFPAALITYKGRQIPVKLLQSRAGISPEEVLNNSIQNLEYAFASAIKKISKNESGRIGFTEGHGELSDQQLSDAMKSLGDSYEVGRVDLNTIPFAGLDQLKVLIIAKPEQPFTEAEKYKIDYFLMSGGRIIWSIDQVSADLDSLRGVTEQLAFAKKLNLDDMLFKYGVRLNYTLLADMNSAQIPVNVGEVGGQSQIQLLPWLFYPVFVPVSTHPLVKNLDGIRSEFPGTIDLISVKGLKSEVILSSSPFNRSLEVPVLLSLQMVEEEPDPKQFQSDPKPFGVLLEGIFPSNFKNRPIPLGIAEPLTIPEVVKPGKMIVLADGDIFKNQINSTDGSSYPLGFDRFTREQYANKNFLLNAADYLYDDSGIISLRNKEIKLRLLDRAKIRQEKIFWQFLNIGLPLILLIACGIFQHYYRIRKYTR